MALHSNSFETLIDSFRKICSHLEMKAEIDLKEIEKECREEFASSEKSLQRFNELITGISETCSEVLNANEILKSATRNGNGGNTITLPYEIQADTVKCISELFNLNSQGSEICEDKLFNKENKQLISELIEVSRKNATDIKDVESTILETRDIFN